MARAVLFAHSQTGHGRVQTWRLHAFDIEPLTADFPQARTLIVVRSERMIKKTGLSTTESRYYLFSAMPRDIRQGMA